MLVSLTLHVPAQAEWALALSSQSEVRLRASFLFLSTGTATGLTFAYHTLECLPGDPDPAWIFRWIPYTHARDMSQEPLLNRASQISASLPTNDRKV